MPTMLTDNFSLDEFIFSQTAARSGIDNTPDETILLNLRHLAKTLELVRTTLGNVPIIISSGYRCPDLNKAIKGAKSSAHLTGLAVDFTAPKFGTVLQTARAIAASDLVFDQIIYEFGRWVHLGVSAPGATLARMQQLSIMVAGKYHPGLGTA